VRLLLAALVPAALLVCLGQGRIELDAFQALAVLAGTLGFGPDPDALHASVVLKARLPRALLSMVSGAGLSVCGAALQGCFRNPLVGPQTVGVLAGAGFGGSLAIFLGLDTPWVMAGAFAFGMASSFFVIWLSRLAGSGSLLMLVLAGIVVGALFAAMTTILQYLADPERQLPQLVFWLMGSFSTASPAKLGWAGAPVLCGMAVLFAYGFRLNVLSCGEEEARSLGVNVGRDRAVVVCTVALVCAAVVAVAGIVGWVGLVVPHVARMLVGPDHSRLLPASACIGACFLLCVDTLCRSATAAELPVGAVTAIVGAPVFIAILRGVCARGWSRG